MIAMGVLIFPAFALFNTGNFVLMFLGHVLIFGFALSLAGGPTAAMFSEMFGSRIRYTGASVGYQLAGVFGAALSPIIAATLFEIFKSGYAIAIYVALNAVISVIAVALMPESRGTDIIEDVEHAALAEMLLLRPGPAAEDVVDREQFDLGERCLVLFRNLLIARTVGMACGNFLTFP